LSVIAVRLRVDRATMNTAVHSTPSSTEVTASLALVQPR
jgi:hypothetical protein